MTQELFISRHGKQWTELRADPMYRDLIEYLRTCDPARTMPNITAKDTTEHSAALLGRIAGYNLILNAIDLLVPELTEQHPEATYADDPVT